MTNFMPRKRLLDMFSQFLKFNTDSLVTWITDNRLDKNMQKLLKPETEQSSMESSQPAQSELEKEHFFARCFYKAWRSQSTDLTNLARRHLFAYLQEPCYNAADKIAQVIAQRGKSTGTFFPHSLSDCFQLALHKTDTVLDQFQPQGGIKLKSYARRRFWTLLRDELRQRQEIDICSDWALLRRLNRTRLEKSLQTYGCSQETIDRHVVTWECFMEVYVPLQATQSRRLERPEIATWMAIAALYNTKYLHRLNPSGLKAQPEDIQRWLETCVKAERSRYPTVNSLNQKKPGQDSDKDSDELMDNLLTIRKEDLLDEIIAQEEQESRNNQRIQIRVVLREALEQLDPQKKQILNLYYGEELTQTQIANQIEITQPTVGRQLSRARRSLLMVLGQWLKKELQITLTSNKLNELSPLLEEWLTDYYQNQRIN